MSEPRVLGGRYELGNVVGRGGMAEVHHGRDIRLERDVAVKTLRTDLARDPTFQARFRREAQSAAQLNHPAVVAVYDTGEEMVDSTATPYIVMEYVEGQTLRDVLQDTQRLMPDRALEITAGVLKALSYSHRMGIIHRDIKPANVMLTGSGEIKVMDFGIARSVSDAQATMTQTAQVIGTAQYLSPEQARGEKVDARSDLYSTGCVLYELLTGSPPFSGDSPVSVAYQHVREDPTPPSHLNPDVPPSVDAIVLKALAKNPDNRYANADDMRADLERALGGLPVHATPVLDNDPTEYLGGAAGATALMDPSDDRQPGHRRKKKSRRALLFTLLAFGLVIALILGLAAWGAMQDDEGPRRVAVPDVVGDAVGAATTELKQAGFNVETEEKFSKKVAEGNVISQAPDAKKRATKGSTVTLTVSKGEKQVNVPPLVGKTRRQAVTALEGAGLDVGQVSKTASGKRKGTVLSSDPASGEQVSAGSTVNLVVSSGTIEVPDVVGESEGQAKAELTQGGFRVRTVYQTTSETEAGEVIAQSPEGGTQSAKGSQVTITVAEEPEDEPTDEPTGEPTPSGGSSPSSPCTNPLGCD
ncbi:MAG: Stk1 family PASTA domain-containing Ser/Thr kinase [Streptosporangiales bacterium]|nr:Stk1 family PASTA domain-containing Ser/Thr kinase [Streptosporangiales bacterium]